MKEIRCPVCGRKLGFFKGEASVKCHKCRSVVSIDTKENRVIRVPTSAVS